MATSHLLFKLYTVRFPGSIIVQGSIVAFAPQTGYRENRFGVVGRGCRSSRSKTVKNRFSNLICDLDLGSDARMPFFAIFTKSNTEFDNNTRLGGTSIYPHPLLSGKTAIKRILQGNYCFIYFLAKKREGGPLRLPSQKITR